MNCFQSYLYTWIRPDVIIFLIILILPCILFAQQTNHSDSFFRKESINTLPQSHLPVKNIFNIPGDSSTSLKGYVKNYAGKNKNLFRQLFIRPVPKFTDSSFKSSALKHWALIPKFSAPYITVTGGRTDYTAFYRSVIDTPFFQKDVYQHQFSTTMNLLIGNQLPMRLNVFMRRTNSMLYRNISDFQLEFDLQAFQQKIYAGSIHNFDITQRINDSIVSKALALKSLEYLKLSNRLENSFDIQKLIEARELLNVPQMSWDITLPDSLAKIKSDSLKKNAEKYIGFYNKAKAEADSIKQLADSLNILSQRIHNILSHPINGSVTDFFKRKQAKNEDRLRQQQMETIPSKYRWLLGLRKFAIGRSQLNYSELSAKNITTRGINIEYNSWYYAAFSAGTIDFRFRNYLFNSRDTYKQYLVMGRLGIGRLEGNYIILSAFRGNKQSFVPGYTGNQLYKFDVTGISMEAKYQINRQGYIKAEIAESVNPNFNKIPVSQTKLDFKDKTNKAYYISLYYTFKKLQANIEGYYKNTGANYQSFSTFQTSASFSSYSIKWDEYFFRRQLRLSASVKRNEFSSPYLIQGYNNNTVFKSVQAVFRKRKWPVLSVSYMPLSQITVVNDLVYENRFNTLNVNASHFYRVGDIRASSSLMLAKFYNDLRDSGYVYFNSSNIFMSQFFNFKRFNAGFTLTHSVSRTYNYNCVDEHIELPVKKIGTILLGFKVNNLKDGETKTGYYSSYRMPLNNHWGCSLFFEEGYIPGVYGLLVKNKTGNIQLTKNF